MVPEEVFTSGRGRGGDCGLGLRRDGGGREGGFREGIQGIWEALHSFARRENKQSTSCKVHTQSRTKNSEHNQLFQQHSSSFRRNLPPNTLTLKGSKFTPVGPPPLLPKGSNADKSEGLLPLKLRPPPKPSSELVGTEKAAKGSLEVLVVAKGSDDRLSSLAPPPSSAPSSRCELVLKPLKLLTGLLDPAYNNAQSFSHTHLPRPHLPWPWQRWHHALKCVAHVARLTVSPHR